MRAIRRFTINPVLPEPLAPLRGLMLNLRWSWHAETRAVFAAIDPAAWERAGRRSGRAAGPGAAGAAGPARRRPQVPARAGRCRARPPRLPGRPALVPGPGRGLAGGGGLLLARVRDHRGAAAVLRRPRHPGRRSPEGGQRPRRPADRRRPAVPARVLHPVPVGRGLAGRAVPGQRPERPAADPAARRRGQPGPDLGRARRRRGAGRAGLDRPGRAGAAAAAGLLRGGERAVAAGGDRPAIRRRHRAPAAPGAAARHRRRAGRPGLLRRHRARRAGRLPHQRGPRGLPGRGAHPGVRRARPAASTRPWRCAGPAPCSPPTPRCPAGIDRFPIDLVRRQFEGQPARPCRRERILALGAESFAGGDPEVFNMAVMGMRLAQRVNGVSLLHGQVSREMFTGLWPGFDTAEVPIGSVTNGVHAPSWVAPEILSLAQRRRRASGAGDLADDAAVLGAGGRRHRPHLGDPAAAARPAGGPGPASACGLPGGSAAPPMPSSSGSTAFWTKTS